MEFAELLKWRRDISFLWSSEIRYCTLLIGLIECAWSVLGLIPDNRSLFTMTLEGAGLDDVWFAVMMMVGLLTTAGAVLPWRSGRHIGLFLSALTWFTLFGVFAREDIFTPVVITMPIFGIFSIALMYADSARKPREKLAD